jgi:hypothetical protein
MPRFRFLTFGLNAPIGLFDAWWALQELEAMLRRSASEKSAHKPCGEDRDEGIAPAQREPTGAKFQAIGRSPPRRRAGPCSGGPSWVLGGRSLPGCRRHRRGRSVPLDEPHVKTLAIVDDEKAIVSVRETRDGEH